MGAKGSLFSFVRNFISGVYELLLMRLLLLLAVCLIASALHAEPNRKIPAQKVPVPPKIDGVVDPAEWAAASSASGFVHVATGEKLSFDATVRVGYDAENLYFAFDCPDSNPGLIRATEYRRNASVEGDDHVVILINPFKTYQSNDKNEFKLGAGGGLIAQFAGGRSAKREWEGAWDGKARITERGWECELVIPWKVLRLPGPGIRDIEVNFARYVPRFQAPIAWCELGAQERLQNNGTLTGIEVPKISQGREILALPYQILGYNDEIGQEVFNTGIDLRYSVTPQISSLMTINPDFQNVEGAILDLAFSRFERLAEERRPFFVEGAGEFRLGGMWARLFAPQRIRAFDLGIKAFGKLSDNQSFGALVTTRFDRETAAVGRFRQTWGPRSYLSAGLVHFNDQDLGIQNSVGSLELIDWRGNWGGDIVWNGSDDTSIGKGHRLDLDLLYQDSHTFAAIGYQEVSDEFLPRIGFVPITGFKGMSYSAFHNREFATGPWSEFSLDFIMAQRDKFDGGGQFLDDLNVSVSGTTRGALELGLWHSESEFMGDSAVLTGAHLTYPENNPYRYFKVSAETGTVDGEDYLLWGAGAQYRFANRLSIGPRLQIEKHGSEENRLGILSANFEIDKNRSISGRAVHRDGRTNWYLAYRNSGNLGTEWYVIVGNPNADTFQKKVVVKAVIPLTIRI